MSPIRKQAAQRTNLCRGQYCRPNDRFRVLRTWRWSAWRTARCQTSYASMDIALNLLARGNECLRMASLKDLAAMPMARSVNAWINSHRGDHHSRRNRHDRALQFRNGKPPRPIRSCGYGEPVSANYSADRRGAPGHAL